MQPPGAPQDGHSNVALSVGGDEVTCRQFVELVTEYFEGALDSRTLSHVEEHLVMCDWCVTYVEQMETTITALGQLSDAAPPDPPAVILAALRARRGS